jgi:hypothetical protein
MNKTKALPEDVVLLYQMTSRSGPFKMKQVQTIEIESGCHTNTSGLKFVGFKWKGIVYPNEKALRQVLP